MPSVNSNITVVTQQSADGKQYKLVNGKHEPYNDAAEVNALIPKPLRHIGQIFYVGDGSIYHYVGGIENENIELKNADTENAVETTYSSLKTLRDNGTLVAGMQYRITDFVTTVGSGITYAQSAGHAFDVIVVADSANKLNENARAIRHEGDTYFPSYTKFEAWELKYCLDNDVLRFDWADSTSGKGVIYFMKDEFGNEIPYDFKNIQFKRFKVSAVSNPDLESQFLNRYYGQEDNSLLTLNMSDSAYLYTFHNETGDKDSSVFNENTYPKSFGLNIIKPNLYITTVDDDNFITMVLNNIVFLVNSAYTNARGNTFGRDCQNSTVGSNFFDNTIGNNFSSNTIGNSFRSNTIGNNAYYNTFGNDVYYNTFGNDVYYNTFGNAVYGNTFGNDVYYNTFGNAVGSNTFGNNVYFVDFGDNKGGYDSTFYGTYLIVKDGVKGTDISRLNIDTGIALLSTTPRQVTVMQSATAGTYIFESRVSATTTEAIEVTI